MPKMKLWLRKQPRLNKRLNKCNKRVCRCSKHYNNNSKYRLNRMLNYRQWKPKMVLKTLRSKDYSKNKLMHRQFLPNNRLKSRLSRKGHSHWPIQTQLVILAPIKVVAMVRLQWVEPLWVCSSLWWAFSSQWWECSNLMDNQRWECNSRMDKLLWECSNLMDRLQWWECSNSMASLLWGCSPKWGTNNPWCNNQAMVSLWCNNLDSVNRWCSSKCLVCISNQWVACQWEECNQWEECSPWEECLKWEECNLWEECNNQWVKGCNRVKHVIACKTILWNGWTRILIQEQMQ